MHSKNFVWQLISRSLNGEASNEEIALLAEVLKKDESLQQRYEILKQFWQSHSLTTIQDENTAIHIERIVEKANLKNLPANNFLGRKKRIKRNRTIRILFGSVAVIIILIEGVLFFSDKKQAINNPAAAIHQPKLTQLLAQNGSRNRTILPDGSVVWLNAGSSLTYASDFKGLTREVYLKGEAFFDVVKDIHHPFIVHANSIDIKVLGTAFNVKSYIEDNKVEATLIRGVIQITRQDKNNQQPVFLHPNEKLVINLTSHTLPDKSKPEHIVTEPDAFKLFHLDSTVKKENIAETSWMYNRLEFRGDNFEELAKKLERWYNVKIIFDDDTVKQLNFNGSFENETIEQAFAALKAAVPFDYTINEHEIFVRSIKETMPD